MNPAERSVKQGRAVDFALRGEFIALDSLLKATGLAPSGGVAKQVIVAGEVRVDGAVERRRSCKIRVGQIVDCAGRSFRIAAAEADERPE